MICSSNRGSGANLEAESVTALGENGSGTNQGLRNYDGALAKLRGGSFTGRGGTDTRGIYNTGSSTDLEAEYVTMLGENGSNDNFGLWNTANALANVTQSVLEGDDNSVVRTTGTATVSNSRLVNAASGTVTWVLVTRGTGAGSVSVDGRTCP